MFVLPLEIMKSTQSFSSYKGDKDIAKQIGVINKPKMAKFLQSANEFEKQAVAQSFTIVDLQRLVNEA